MTRRITMSEIDALESQKPEEIRQQIDETRSVITEKLEALEQQVTGTVQNAKETVEQTIESVKSSLTDTVEVVKETFDIRLQVQRHPWAMVGGSAALGFVVGQLLEGRKTTSFSRRRPPLPYPDAPTASPSYAAPQQIQESDSLRSNGSAGYSHSSHAGSLGGLLSTFDDEIQKLKGIGIGYVMGWLRDHAKEAMPQLAPQVDDLVNNMTLKMGGTPIAQVATPPRQSCAHV